MGEKRTQLRNKHRFPEFDRILSRFSGERVAYAWFGDHSVIYVEVGKELSPRQGNHPRHERHVFPGYDWRLLMAGGRAVRRSDREEQAVGAYLAGKKITAASVTDSHELSISLADGGLLESVAEVGSSPEWELRDRESLAAYGDHMYAVES